MTPRRHDARKGRHYYTRWGHCSARPGNDASTSEASQTVYSSDAPCGRHGGLAVTLGKRLVIVAIVVIADGPEIAATGGNPRHSTEEGGVGVGWVWIGDEVPGGAVPLLNEVQVAIATGIGADCPDVGSRDGSYSLQAVAVCARAGAGDNAPGIAVPVFSQRLVSTTREVVADGPEVLHARDTGHAVQEIGNRAWIGWQSSLDWGLK